MNLCKGQRVRQQGYHRHHRQKTSGYSRRYFRQVLYFIHRPIEDHSSEHSFGLLSYDKYSLGCFLTLPVNLFDDDESNPPSHSCQLHQTTVYSRVAPFWFLSHQPTICPYRAFLGMNKKNFPLHSKNLFSLAMSMKVSNMLLVCVCLLNKILFFREYYFSQFQRRITKNNAYQNKTHTSFTYTQAFN